MHVALPLEYLVERLAEHLRDAERGFEAGRIFPRLDRRDRLARQADAVAKLGLRHLARHEAQQADLIDDLPGAA